MNGYYDQEYREVIGEQDDFISVNRRVWLSWEDLRFQVPESRGIWGISSPKNYMEKLKGVWGGTGPGEILAILGEMKSEKSLILKILAGNVEINRGDLISGRVMVNGCPRGENWRRFCSFVAQSHAEYHGLLKVEEQLLFRSQLCLPEHFGGSKRKNVVEWVLDSLDLDNVRNFLVDDLNLFEKRKLAIGLALIGLPRVLLLDEPTDGLDPTRSFELIKIIRRITQQLEMTTIITAKQLRQSSIPLIDKILLVAHGATMYYGAISDAIQYFENRLNISIPEKGNNPLICMLDAVSCLDSRRDPNNLENIRKEWESYASEHQVYRSNYPNVLIEGNTL